MRFSLRISFAYSVLFFAIPILAACPDPVRTPDAGSSNGGAPRSVQRVAPSLAQADEDPSMVIATMGDEEITLGEIDESIRAEIQRARMEYATTLYQLRRSGIDRHVAEILFKAEAKKRGFDDEETFIRKEVEEGTSEPTEEELEAFYKQNQQMMGGQPFDAIKGQIGPYLHQQKKQERFMSLLEGLKEDANITIILEEPRVEVDASGPSQGPEDAPVTIVEFSDYLCPHCKRAKDVMDQVKEAYPDKVRVVFWPSPNMQNETAVRAATAALCADRQGHFPKMHTALFGAGRAMSRDDIKGYAEAIEGLDIDKFDACMDGDEIQERLNDSVLAGHAAGIRGTPAFFVNGVPFVGAQSLETFKEVIDSELER